MRKGFMLPTFGMIGAFLLGIGLMLLWGISGAIYGSHAVSEFFSSFAILIQYPVVGVIFIVVLIVAIIKFWYFVGPFFMGVLVGLFILMFLGSSLYSGIGGGASFIVMHDRARVRKNLVTAPGPKTIIGRYFR